MDQTKPNQAQGRWKLLAVLLVCASPLIFSYLTYYVIKPTSRNNYGTLIDPRSYPIPATLGTVALDGKPASLEQFKGKWIMLQAAPGDCREQCRKQLITMRQLRIMTGKDRDRVERVWLVTDETPPDREFVGMIEGARMLRVKPEAVKTWLPVEPGGDPANHMYLIDPMGHLMMRFPQDADPTKVKKDILKLLKASAIG